MTSDEAPVKGSRTISMGAFWGLVFAMTLPLIVFVTGFAVWADKKLGFPAVGRFGVGLPAVCLTVSFFAVDRVLKRYGLSHSGKTRRSGGGPSQSPRGRPPTMKMKWSRFGSQSPSSTASVCYAWRVA